MNVMEHLLVVANEESGEVAEAALFAAMAFPALGAAKVFDKLLRFSPHGIHPITQQTAIEMLVMELNDLQALVEMVQEAGLALPGLRDRNAIDAKKAKVRMLMRESAMQGTLTLPS